MNRIESILDGMTAEARPIINQYYLKDSCIASTRISMEVLAYYQIASKPLPVRVWVANAVASHLIETGQGETIANNDQAWLVGIGYLDGKPVTSSPENRFPAHLVAYVAGRYLLDLSIDQAIRSEKKIALSPLYGDIGEQFNSPGKLWIHKNAGTGVTLTYSYAPDLEGTWCESPNWKEENYNTQPTKWIIRKLREMGFE